MDDNNYMRKVLSLAEKGCGFVSPNPLVGAVLVKNGKIIGKGYHKKFGGNHAEVDAINNACESTKNSVLFVNLEPCSHFGKTPPCVNRIIESGIKEVYISHYDPNPLVSGKGIAILKKAGIKVKAGIMGKEAGELNETYLKFIKTGRPYVILKTGASIDGKIAAYSGDSKWITGRESRDYVYSLRSKVDAVLVGINTVLLDNPYLTCHNKGTGRNPKKIVIDSRGRIPVKSNVFKQAENLILATTKLIPEKKAEAIREKGAEVIFIKESRGHVDLPDLLGKLGKRNITSILVEGGSEINGSFFDKKLVDKVLFFVAPVIIGGCEAYNCIGGKGVSKMKDAVSLKDLRLKKIGKDYLFEGYPDFSV